MMNNNEADIFYESKSENYKNFQKNRNSQSLLDDAECQQEKDRQQKYREKWKKIGYPQRNTHKYDFRKRQEYRCTIYKIIQMSVKYPDGIPVTHLMRQAGLSNCQYKYYSKYMLETGLVTRQIDWYTARTIDGKSNGNPRRVKYKPTEKGLKYLQLYNGLKTLFNVNDGLNLFGYDSF